MDKRHLGPDRTRGKPGMRNFRCSVIIQTLVMAMAILKFRMICFRYPSAGNTSPFPPLHPNSASPSHGSSTCASLPDIHDKKGKCLKSYYIFS